MRSKSRSSSANPRLVSESMELTGDASLSWCHLKYVTPDELFGWWGLTFSEIEGDDGSTPVLGRAELEEAERKLEKDVRRKNDALAETTALLVLQKKPQELFGEEK